MKKALSILVLALVLVMSLSITAMAYSGTESVELEAYQTEATTAQVACYAAKASGRNSPKSNGNVDLILQLNVGDGWYNRAFVTMSPGTTGETLPWGRVGVVHLGRAKICTSDGSTGCIGSATVTVTE